MLKRTREDTGGNSHWQDWRLQLPVTSIVLCRLDCNQTQLINCGKSQLSRFGGDDAEEEMVARFHQPVAREGLQC